MVLGAAGNFGSRISFLLAKNNISQVIVGRDKNKLIALRNKIIERFANASIEVVNFDINKGFSKLLSEIKPLIVINTCGPFQSANYDIVLDCIKNKAHYIDLADGRDFVNGISQFDTLAKTANISVISGASTVPCLSSAVVEYYKSEFSNIDLLKYGISPGQKADRGLATTQSILSYVGKPLKPYTGMNHVRYGWQDIYRQSYPELGNRWMANCDIPDLDIFSDYFKIQTVQFSAGIESNFLFLSLWLMSWLVRWQLPLNLPYFAKPFLAISHWFDCFGSDDGGMHVILSGKDHAGKPKSLEWFIIAKNGDGPYIPTIPAIVLAKKILAGDVQLQGAMTCVSLVTLDEYLDELKNFSINVIVK